MCGVRVGPVAHVWRSGGPRGTRLAFGWAPWHTWQLRNIHKIVCTRHEGDNHVEDTGVTGKITVGRTLQESSGSRDFALNHASC